MPIENVTSAVTQAQASGKLLKTFADYYAGRHELKFASADFRSKYGSTVGDTVLSIRENLCPAVVTAFTDGIEVTNWGTGDAQDTAAEEGLSRLQAMVDREAWKTGDAFVLVWPGADGQPAPSFQPAHAMVPHVDPLNPDQLDWCAKVWFDEGRKRGRVNVYTPAGCERWETTGTLVADARGRADLPEQATGWQPCTDDEGDWITHPFGAVPVCWFKREAESQEAHGTSILADVIPLQDGLNKSLADLIVTSEAYSRPFWYLLNVKPQGQPVNPAMSAAGLPLGPQVVAAPAAAPVTNATPSWSEFNAAGKGRFDPNRQRIFTHDGPGPFGQLDPPDLTRLLQVQDGFALKVARVVGVPAYYFTQTSGDVPSGESLRVLSTRRTGRIRAWHRDAGPVWRGVKQLLGMGDEPIQWANPMPLDETERLMIASEKKALGYSFADVVAYLGEADADGIVQRAAVEQQATAQGIAAAFMAGEGDATY